MRNPKARARLWLVLLGGILIPTAHETVAQTVVCFKKKCVVYSNGEAVCQYTPVDCSLVSIQ